MKTRTFVLNDTITARRIKQLISRMELCKAKYINLYLHSDGGLTDMADIFIDFTGRTNKKINFIGIGVMASACMHIFLDAKGKKSIMPYTAGMLHLTSIDPESRELRNKNSLASVMLKETNNENEDRLKKYVIIFDLTEKEKKILQDGGDLGIDYERLKKALPKINKLKK